MSTRIGLLSDIHATPAPLREALEIFAREGVVKILCAGDIAGYGSELVETVELLSASGCRAILGNHDLWCLDDADDEERGVVDSYLRHLPLVVDVELEGCRIVMVHGAPPLAVMEGIKLLDEEGEVVAAQRELWDAELTGFEADVLVVGHTHQVFAERLGDVLVINPGSTRFNHTCAILTLPELRVEFLPLGGRQPKLAWNWGMQYRRPE